MVRVRKNSSSSKGVAAQFCGMSSVFHCEMVCI